MKAEGDGELGGRRGAAHGEEDAVPEVAPGGDARVGWEPLGDRPRAKPHENLLVVRG